MKEVKYIWQQCLEWEANGEVECNRKTMETAHWKECSCQHPKRRAHATPSHAMQKCMPMSCLFFMMAGLFILSIHGSQIKQRQRKSNKARNQVPSSQSPCPTPNCLFLFSSPSSLSWGKQVEEIINRGGWGMGNGKWYKKGREQKVPSPRQARKKHRQECQPGGREA